MSSPNIALVGASGSIGQILLKALIAAGLNVLVVTRTTSTATFPPGTTVRKSDFSSTDLEEAFRDQDAVVSALGATGFGEQKKLIDAAIAAGVARFIPSEFSADSLNDAVLGLLPLFGQKKEAIEYLKAKQSNSFSWTGICSSGLFDWGIANGFLGYDIANKTATIWDGGDKKFTLTNKQQLGAAVVSVLQHPKDTANQYLYISSVETSQNEILAALEDATSSAWTVKATTTQHEVDEAQKKLQAGDFSGAFALVRATIFSNVAGLGANYARDRVHANGLLGLADESVKETIQRVVEAAKHA
ncbi:hypothetical protein BDV18DRAFT_161680 [Aspergillus unguis]